MKSICLALLLAGCAAVSAQTNAPVDKAQQVEVSSEWGYFDGLTNQMVYIGHVFVTDNDKARLHCERLTVDVPRDGSEPTNILAETNVTVDLLENGRTTHVTAARALYVYGLTTNAVGVIITNQTVTFTGGTDGNPMPMVETADAILTGEPLTLDVPSQKFGGPHYKTIFKQKASAGGTNASPFNFLK
jgi:lipopolysaccharide export system protein LptA